MKSFLALAAATLALTGQAAASSDNRCGNVPQAQWMSMDAIAGKAVALGYTVRRVKIDDGCYEVYATDAKGALVEAYFHPATGEVVKTEVQN